MIVGTWETLPHAKFCKNCVRDIPLWGKYIPKISNFFAILVRVTTVKFGVRLRTWDTLHRLNFVKIAQGDLSLGGNFYQKFEIFAIFSCLSPYFYTDNVKILVKRTEDLGIHQRHKISSESLKGPVNIALPREGDA